MHVTLCLPPRKIQRRMANNNFFAFRHPHSYCLYIYFPCILLRSQSSVQSLTQFSHHRTITFPRENRQVYVCRNRIGQVSSFCCFPARKKKTTAMQCTLEVGTVGEGTFGEERSKSVDPIDFGSKTADKSSAYAIHRHSPTRNSVAVGFGACT